MLRNTISKVIILALLIYETKVEKYVKNLHTSDQNLALHQTTSSRIQLFDSTRTTRRSLWWFQAVPKASGRWQNTTEVGYTCSIGREARKNAVGHICPIPIAMNVIKGLLQPLPGLQASRLQSLQCIVALMRTVCGSSSSDWVNVT
jgi:hypothetical protein